MCLFVCSICLFFGWWIYAVHFESSINGQYGPPRCMVLPIAYAFLGKSWWFHSARLDVSHFSVERYTSGISLRHPASAHIRLQCYNKKKIKLERRKTHNKINRFYFGRLELLMNGRFENKKCRAKMVTHSEICTNKSSVPLCGVINPCPLPRLKLFTMPVSMGLASARAELPKHWDKCKNECVNTHT